jgi:cytochrome P450
MQGVCLFLGNVVYNVWFHPLAKFPGPRWNAVCHLPASYNFLRGKFPWYLHSLHERYGDVVRIRPGTLSFSSSQASRDILINKSGRDQLQKDPELFFKSPNGAYSILSTPSDTDHSRYRRLLSNGFSERAIRDQETVLETYVDLLIQGLRQNADKGPQDMVAWFNWTTFDVIGELTFDRSFDCLRKQAYHEWIPFVFGGVKAIMIRSELSRYPLISRIMMWLDREKILAAREKGFRFAEERVNHRFASATDRLDFFSHILRKEGKEREMSRAEILATSSTLILGGSDTTATLLAGTVYYLLQNPQSKQKLVAEIRGRFTDEAEISITTVSKLPYLLATLEEGMRIYPPVALGSPRIVGDEGAVLGGYHVPPKVSKFIHENKGLVEIDANLDSRSQQPVRGGPFFEELPQTQFLRP